MRGDYLIGRYGNVPKFRFTFLLSSPELWVSIMNFWYSHGLMGLIFLPLVPFSRNFGSQFFDYGSTFFFFSPELWGHVWTLAWHIPVCGKGQFHPTPPPPDVWLHLFMKLLKLFWERKTIYCSHYKTTFPKILYVLCFWSTHQVLKTVLVIFSDNVF